MPFVVEFGQTLTSRGQTRVKLGDATQALAQETWISYQPTPWGFFGRKLGLQSSAPRRPASVRFSARHGLNCLSVFGTTSYCQPPTLHLPVSGRFPIVKAQTSASRAQKTAWHVPAVHIGSVAVIQLVQLDVVDDNTHNIHRLPSFCQTEPLNTDDSFIRFTSRSSRSLPAARPY